MQIDITITFQDSDTQRTLTITDAQITIGFVRRSEQARKSGEFGDIITAYGKLLKLTEDELDQISLADFRKIAEAVNTMLQASNDPKA